MKKKNLVFRSLNWSIGQIKKKKNSLLLKNVQKSHFKLRVLDAIIPFGYIKLTNPIEYIPIIDISGGPPAVARKMGDLFRIRTNIMMLRSKIKNGW